MTGITMHVSYGELFRSMNECVRMVGYPFGQADDCVQGLVWTQAALGKSYDLLRMAEERQPPTNGAACMVQFEDKHSLVDIADNPLFAMAARLADLVYVKAYKATDSTIGITVTRTFGGWIVPFIAKSLARRGCQSVCLWYPGETSDDAALEASSFLCAATPQEKSNSHLLAISPTALGAASEPPVGHADATDAICEPATQWFREALESQEASLVVCAVAPCAGSHFALARSIARRLAHPELVPDDVGALNDEFRIRTAIEVGLRVQAADHDFFVELAGRIRVPSSERSRRQAG